jgi:Flp pilus assembly protein TadG
MTATQRRGDMSGLARSLATGPRTLRERGAVAIEMAIVLPLLLLILGGIVDLGRAFSIHVVLTNAAREGARAGVVLTTGTPNAAIKARAEAAANSLSTATAVVNFNCVPPTTSTSISKVTVSAPMTYFFLDAFGFSLPTTLSRSATMGCS